MTDAVALFSSVRQIKDGVFLTTLSRLFHLHLNLDEPFFFVLLKTSRDLSEILSTIRPSRVHFVYIIYYRHKTFSTLSTYIYGHVIKYIDTSEFLEKGLQVLLNWISENFFLLSKNERLGVDCRELRDYREIESPPNESLTRDSILNHSCAFPILRQAVFIVPCVHQKSLVIGKKYSNKTKTKSPESLFCLFSSEFE